MNYDFLIGLLILIIISLVLIFIADKIMINQHLNNCGVLNLTIQQCKNLTYVGLSN